MQKINKIVLSVGVLSSAVALSASAQYATPTRPELRADMSKEVKGEVRDMRDAMRSATASGTGMVSTSSREDMKNQIKGVRKEFAKDRYEDRKNMIDKMKEMHSDNSLKSRLMATATIEILAAKLGVSTSSLFNRVASGTKLKEIIGDKVSRDEMAKILHPIVYERVASSSEAAVPKLLQKIFGARKETVTSSIDEKGDVVEEVKSNANFFRKLFGF